MIMTMTFMPILDLSLIHISLTLRSLPLFLILAAASLVLYSLVAWAIGRAAAVVRAWKAGRQKNAPNSRRRGHGA